MTKSTKYNRYQDYVIRDGRLVGEFEEMYRDFDDPWEQSSHEPAALDKTIGLSLLGKHGHRRVLEYGCGFGHFTARLHRELGAAAGVDVSPTAIAKARSQFPDATFYVGDILDAAPILGFRPDALVFAEISWYVLDSLVSFKKLMADRCSGAGFLHMLTVYPEGQQKYGKEFFTNIEEICEYWSDVVDIEEWGGVTRKDAGGVTRTFLYGTVKRVPGE